MVHITHDELVDELQARGFENLTDTRASRYVNQAMHELDEMYRWPYREDSATGTAPLTISDLGTIELVTDETNDNVLQPRQWRDLVYEYGDVSTSGTPEFYYVAWPSGSPVVATYPVSSSVTIGVQYWKIAADITGSTSPDSPARYHNIIVDLAARRAYRDVHRHSDAEALAAQIQRDIAAMVNQLLVPQAQAPDSFVNLDGDDS